MVVNAVHGCLLLIMTSSFNSGIEDLLQYVEEPNTNATVLLLAGQPQGRLMYHQFLIILNDHIGVKNLCYVSLLGVCAVITMHLEMALKVILQPLEAEPNENTNDANKTYEHLSEDTNKSVDNIPINKPQPLKFVRFGSVTPLGEENLAISDRVKLNKRKSSVKITSPPKTKAFRLKPVKRCKRKVTKLPANYRNMMLSWSSDEDDVIVLTP